MFIKLLKIPLFVIIFIAIACNLNLALANQDLVASITPNINYAFEGQLITFTASAEGSEGTLHYSWSEQNGVGGTSRVKTYAMPSINESPYEISCTVTDDIGSDTATENITICNVQKINLGSTKSIASFNIAKIYVPTKYGGTLKLSGDYLKLFYTDGSDLTLEIALQIINDNFVDNKVYYGNNCEYDIPSEDYGWYYIKVDSDTAINVASEFVQIGEATTRPWNGWYWPTAPNTNPNLYDNGCALDKYDQVYNTSAQNWEQNNHVGTLFWEGHCPGWAVASIVKTQPSATTKNGVNFTQDDMEGLYTELAYCGYNYNLSLSVKNIPAGPPTSSSGELVDAYCDDFHEKTRNNISMNNNAVYSNLRDGSTPLDSSEVWCHAIYKYSSSMIQAPNQNDEKVIKITTIIYANNDGRAPPSTGTSDRTETYNYILEYNDGEIVNNSIKQNWLSATHYVPKNIIKLNFSIWQAENPDVTKSNVDNLYQ